MVVSSLCLPEGFPKKVGVIGVRDALFLLLFYYE